MDAPEPRLHVVLYQPQIPPNTGNAGRLCLGVGARLHVVHPIAFSMDEKAVRRAGLDYWKHVDLMEHASPADFWAWVGDRTPFGFTTKATVGFQRIAWQQGAILVFGCETKGLPADALGRCSPVCIPMDGPIRSLNLSNAVAVGVYGALRTIESSVFGEG